MAARGKSLLTASEYHAIYCKGSASLNRLLRWRRMQQKEARAAASKAA
jgi:hypothetical protein